MKVHRIQVWDATTVRGFIGGVVKAIQNAAGVKHLKADALDRRLVASSGRRGYVRHSVVELTRKLKIKKGSERCERCPRSHRSCGLLAQAHADDGIGICLVPQGGYQVRPLK
jgi:hypothetical protein